MDNNYLTELIKKYTSETLTEEEGRELAGILDNQQYQQQFQKLLQEQLVNGELIIEPADEKAFVNISNNISKQIHAKNTPVRIIGYWQKAWWHYAAAVILFISIGVYLWNTSPTPVTTGQIPGVTVPEILPGKNKALLVLGDESIFDLDSLLPGQSLIQGDMQVIKSADGELLYTPVPNPQKRDAVFTNTMKTPNGGQYQLTLPDGTQAWLNAASSITYPTRFTGNTRSVKVSGEVYLEVAKNKSKPFIVNTGSEEIVVLGTAFNINKYPGEISKISLIEGAVKINGQLLKPGQAFSNGVVKPTNTEQDIAWRNGVFNFNDQSLSQVMQQITRWYDVEVVYEGKAPQIEFTGELSRLLTLAEVVEFLKGSQVNVEWKNNKLLIKNNK